MLTFRTFRNTDPPVLAALWRSRAGQPGLLQPVSPDLLEQMVFAKLYFDYGGLVLAFDDGRPVGFAHAGFGPQPAASWISTDVGVTCMMLVRPDCAETEVADGLLDHCEEYLRCPRGRGSLRRRRRAVEPVLRRPLRRQRVAGRARFGRGRPAGLRGPRLPGSRAYGASAARTERIRVADGSPADAGAAADDRGSDGRRPHADLVGGMHDRRVRSYAVRSRAARRRTGRRLRHVPQHGAQRHRRPSAGRRAWSPLAVDEAYRRRGLALFLLSEAFCQFLRQGIMHVEVQTRSTNAAALGMFLKLGFQPAGEGGVWRKD